MILVTYEEAASVDLCSKLEGMLIRSWLTLIFLGGVSNLLGQTPFGYTLTLEPVSIDGLPGLHSYVHAQHEGKWLIIGGRLDGLHARQPFNAFPASSNNTQVMVVDPVANSVVFASVNSLPLAVAEQFQSTNLNFFQDGDHLLVVGGYAYAASVQDHVTFSLLTVVDVPAMISAVENGASLAEHVQWVSDDYFAVTGGHLNKLGDEYYLVGGHRFDGRYNPMNNPTFVQAYTNAVRRFTCDVSSLEGSVTLEDPWVDPIHLRRRDYNLAPFVASDGTVGLSIFSGVFQLNADLPFLYPVDITEEGFTPRTEFNQYLSHYHSARATLYESSSGATHTLFFGGMSQFYYDGEQLIEDPLVPFVKTISLVTREANGDFSEHRLPLEFQELNGASSEFIPNLDLPHHPSEFFYADEIEGEDFIIGYIYGGIGSSLLNPFSSNQTGVTSAHDLVYAVRLTRDETSDMLEVKGRMKPEVLIYPNPADTTFTLSFTLEQAESVSVFLTDLTGRMVLNADLGQVAAGDREFEITLDDDLRGTVVLVTVVIGNRDYTTQRVIIKG